MQFVKITELLFLVYKIGKEFIEYKNSKSQDFAGNGSEFLGEISARLANSLDKIMEDNRVDITDIFEIIKLLKTASELVGFDFKGAAKEILTGDKEALGAVIQKFKQEFDLKDDIKEIHIEVILSHILNIINSLGILLKTFEDIK